MTPALVSPQAYYPSYLMQGTDWSREEAISSRYYEARVVCAFIKSELQSVVEGPHK